MTGPIERVKTSPRLQRRLFTASVVLFAVGVVAVVVTAFRYDAPKETAAASDQGSVPAIKVQKRVPMSDEVKAAAERWILGAVTRRDLAGTFDLTHQDIRGEMTRTEWASGDIPVIPYAADQVPSEGWKVDYSYADEALLEVSLIPSAKAPAGTRPLTFFIGLVKVGEGANAKWLVNYWAPRWKPPVRLPQ